jgi:ketosteroid isomerase-like protein
MKTNILILNTLIALLSPLFVGGFIPFQPVAHALAASDPSVPLLIAKEQEVRQFFDKYVERYTKMDTEGFLSLFSLKARQNQMDKLPEIRTMYTDLFNRSRSLQISFEDMKIEIYQNAVETKARYSVSQVLKEGGEKKVWKGDVRWVLAKEEGKLAIISIDYRYSMPPTLVVEREGKLKEEPAKRVVAKPEIAAPSLANEEEVKQFFSDYIRRYDRKDIDGFLSFFSSKAVQNQKDGLKGIKNIYSKFFDESQELKYRVEGMKIEIYQNAVEVRARFRVDQTLKKRAEEKVWTGTIHWVLAKEDGALKIISLDYQNDKTPSKKEEAERK